LLVGLALAACNLNTDNGGQRDAPTDELAATRQSLAPMGEILLVRVNHDRDVLGLPALTPSQALNQARLGPGHVHPQVPSAQSPGDESVPAQDLMAVAGYQGRS
jgi:hypothetical protein